MVASVSIYDLKANILIATKASEDGNFTYPNGMNVTGTQIEARLTVTPDSDTDSVALSMVLMPNEGNTQTIPIASTSGQGTFYVQIPKTFTSGEIMFRLAYESSILGTSPFTYTATGICDVEISCETDGAQILWYPGNMENKFTVTIPYTETIVGCAGLEISAYAKKDGMEDSDFAHETCPSPLPAPVLSIGQKSSLENAWYVMLDNVSSYPDDATVYYTHTQGSEEGNMTIQSIKNGIAGVAGAIAMVSLLTATLFVTVSCPGYTDSPGGDITLQELETPSCSYSRISSSQGRVTISNYADYPSGTKLVINNSEYDPASYVNLSIGTSATSVTVYAKYDGDEPYMTESTRVSGTIPAYVAPTPTFPDFTPTVTIVPGQGLGQVKIQVICNNAPSNSSFHASGTITVGGSMHVPIDKDIPKTSDNTWYISYDQIMVSEFEITYEATVTGSAPGYNSRSKTVAGTA